MTKIFSVPFATTGDRESIPQDADTDGFVSYEEGYGPHYSLDPVEWQDAKDIERTKLNGILHDITESVFELQRHGVAKWSVDAAPYPIKARVYHDGKVWRSDVANNSTTPGTGSSWVEDQLFIADQPKALAGTDNTAAMSALRVFQAFQQFGLGSTTASFPGGNLDVIDNSVPTGLYKFDSTMTGVPVGASNGNVLHMRRAAGGGESQLAFIDGGVGQGTMVHRVRQAAGWLPWRTSWDNVNFDPATKLNTSGGALTGPLQIQPAADAALEIGRQDGVASTPYIDFHSGAVAVNYDSRIIAVGGNGSDEGGELRIRAALINAVGALHQNGQQVWHAGNPASQSQALAGTDNTVGMTPLRVFQAFQQFGLGNSAAMVAVSDMNTVFAGGMYRTNDTTANTPAGASTKWGTVLVLPGNATNSFQLWSPENLNGEVWTRRRSGSPGSWGAWNRQWDNGNFDPSTKLDKSGGTLTGSLLLQPAGNAIIEMGRQDGVASAPYIDFHSGATATDFDSRIIATGGNGSNGGGTLQIQAETLTVVGNLKVNSNTVWHGGNFTPSSKLDKSGGVADSLRYGAASPAAVSGAVTCDVSTKQHFNVSATAPINLTFSNLPSGTAQVLPIVLNVTGGSVVSFTNAQIRWDEDTTPEPGANWSQYSFLWDGTYLTGVLRAKG